MFSSQSNRLLFLKLICLCFRVFIVSGKRSVLDSMTHAFLGPNDTKFLYGNTIVYIISSAHVFCIFLLSHGLKTAWMLQQSITRFGCHVYKQKTYIVCVCKCRHRHMDIAFKEYLLWHLSTYNPNNYPFFAISRDKLQDISVLGANIQSF